MTDNIEMRLCSEYSRGLDVEVAHQMFLFAREYISSSDTVNGILVGKRVENFLKTHFEDDHDKHKYRVLYHDAVVLYEEARQDGN